MNRKGFVSIMVVGIIVLIILGVIGYFVWKNSSEPQTPENLSQQSSSTIAISEAAASTTLSTTTTTSSSQSQSLSVPTSSPAITASVPVEFQNKVAFLKNGEVWIANEDGSEANQITNTSGTVGQYSFSLNGSYLEYENLAQTKIDVLNTQNDILIKEITGSDFGNSEPYIYPQFLYWFDNNAFFANAYFADGTGPLADVSPGALSVFSFMNSSSSQLFLASSTDALDSEANYIDYVYLGIKKNNINYSNGTYSPLQINYPFMFYTDMGSTTPQGGGTTDFNLFNEISKENTLLGSWSSTSSAAGGASVNYQNNDVAFVGSLSSDTAPMIMLYSKPNIPLYSLASGESATSIGDLQWSFDDKYIAALVGSWKSLSSYEEGGEPDYSLVLINVNNPANPQIIDLGLYIYGSNRPDFAWTRSDELIFSKNNNLYLYNLQTQSSAFFSASSSLPFVF